MAAGSNIREEVMKERQVGEQIADIRNTTVHDVGHYLGLVRVLRIVADTFLLGPGLQRDRLCLNIDEVTDRASQRDLIDGWDVRRLLSEVSWENETEEREV